MNNPITDQELDSFFDWLKPKLPKPIRVACTPPPAISQELLDMARQTAQDNLVYLIQSGEAFSQRILPLAASDGMHKTAPIRFKGVMPESIGGEWSLTREDLPQDPNWQILKFKCREELIETIFRGRTVEVRIGEETYSLGKIDRRGLAEAEIPRGLDLQQEIEVRFSAN